MNASGMVPMKRNVSISQVLALPLPLPGDLACGALGLGKQHDLVVNSLEWAALGVPVVIFAT
jgi:hypothetical protein